MDQIHELMNDLVEESENKYHARSRYGVELNEKTFLLSTKIQLKLIRS